MRPLSELGPTSNCGTALHDGSSSVFWTSADLEKFDPVRFPEIARILLVPPIVPMFMYTKAAAADAVTFGIINCLRRWVMSQGSFAQVIISIRHIREIRPFGNEEIEADGIDRDAVK